MSKALTILITNDDGIQAEGLWHLWDAVKHLGDVKVVAPCSQRSGSSTAITFDRPLKIHHKPMRDCTDAWQVSGTPADCVKAAVSILDFARPDIILSGINSGSNAGRNVLYSGTVGGAIEGVLRGIPGVAFSCTHETDPDHSAAALYIPRIVEHLLEHPLPRGTLLNVNFPDQAHDDWQGVRLARQGRGFYTENPHTTKDHDGETLHWIGGQISVHEEEHDSDIELLSQGYATAVPLHVDQLTDHEDLDRRRAHFDRLFDKIAE